jgi:hypothetical protein
MLSFTVSSWFAWAPGLDAPDDWERQGSNPIAADLSTVPNVKDLPMMMRRRLSRLGRMAMRVAHDAGQRGGEGRLVFSSRYGEVALTVDLLIGLAKKEKLSPTAFSLSVHNALAGLLSIYRKNRLPHTAIAAGEESFCAGLMEAAAMLLEDSTTPVLLVHYDEPLPEFYRPYVDDSVPSLALALVLEAAPPQNEAHLDFGFCTRELCIVRDDTDPALGFIRFLAKNEKEWSWSDADRNWWCRRNAA